MKALYVSKSFQGTKLFSGMKAFIYGTNALPIKTKVNVFAIRRCSTLEKRLMKVKSEMSSEVRNKSLQPMCE